MLDRIIHVVETLWIWILVAVLIGSLPLWPASWVVGLLRRLPALRDRLALTAARLERWRDRVIGTYLTGFWGAVLFPVALVVVPVVGITVLLLRLLVPASDPAPDHDAKPRHHGFLSHLISLKTMDWPLRLVTGLAVAQLIAAAALLAIAHSGPATPVPVEMIDGHPAHVDRLVLIAAGVFLVVAWSLVLAGAWVTRVSRLLVMAILSVTTIPSLSWEPATWIWVGLIGWLWVAAIVMPIPASETAPGTGKPPAARHVVRALGFAAFFTVYLGAWWQRAGGGAVSPAFLLRDQLFRLALVLTPVLFLTGSDFAEVGQAVGRVVDRIGSWRRPAIGVPIVALLSAAVMVAVLVWKRHLELQALADLGSSAVISLVASLLFYGAFRVTERSGCVGVGLMVVILGALMFSLEGVFLKFLLTVGLALVAVYVVGVIIRRAELERWPAFSVPFSGLAVAALVLTGTGEAAALLLAGFNTPTSAAESVHFSIHRYQGRQGRFSVWVPDRWRVAYSADSSLVTFGSADNSYDEGVFLVSRVDVARLEGPNSLKPEKIAGATWDLLEGASYPGSSFGMPTEAGPWRAKFGSAYRDGKRYEVMLLHQFGGDGFWLAASVSATRYQDYFQTIFTSMVRSWRFEGDGPAPAPIPAVDPARRAAHVVGFGWIPVLLAPAGLLLLTRWRKPGPFGAPPDRAALFVVFVGITTFLFLPETQLVRLVWERHPAEEPFGSLAIVTAGITVLAVLGTVIGGRLAGARRLLSPLIRLSVGLTILGVFYRIYGSAIEYGESSVKGQAIVLVAALAWDLLMSGKEITNVDGRVFRRPSRVMMYLGYIMLVGTCVLFFSSLDLAGTDHHLENVLEAEEIVRQGLVWLGAPLLLLSFFLQLRRVPEG